MSMPFHGLTTHVGYLAPGSVPGVPDMVTISSTPNRDANSITLNTSSACLRPSPGRGEVGFPEALRPVSATPASSNTPR